MYISYLLFLSFIPVSSVLVSVVFRLVEKALANACITVLYLFLAFIHKSVFVSSLYFFV